MGCGKEMKKESKPEKGLRSGCLGWEVMRMVGDLGVTENGCLGCAVKTIIGNLRVTERWALYVES